MDIDLSYIKMLVKTPVNLKVNEFELNLGDTY